MEQQEFLSYLTSYERISELVKTCSYEEILSQAAALMEADPADLEYYPVIAQAAGRLEGLYQHALKDMQKHILHYDRLYTRLEDNTSRLVLANLAGHRILPAPSFLEQAYRISSEFVFPGGYMCEEVTSFEKDKDWLKDGISRIFFDVGGGASDLWVKPALLDVICPGYRLFLRCEDMEGVKRTVIYALPPKKPQDSVYDWFKKPKEPKRIVALAPYERGWSDAEIVKDCGVIPYLLHKNHGCDVTMTGAPGAEYTNLKYIPGVKMEFLPNGSIHAKEEYIREQAEKIDCLVLRGVYPDYIPVVDIYKRYNPDGKVFLPLDANSLYMDRIQWTDPDFCRFMSQCDVISTSGRAMRRHLNEKWPWVIEHIPNGFFGFLREERVPEFDKKENIILTAGRLGSEQKATHVLLEAFAQAADQLPGWELHLAGNVEPAFEEYLNSFWQTYPNLKGRIRFLGHITDRDTLYEIYVKAKIFALTSAWEGGTPNVVAEAPHAGDVIAVTKIDEYEEATDSGRRGMASGIGDVEGFRDILISLCKSPDLEAMSRRAYAYAGEHYDMEYMVKKLYYLIFGEGSIRWVT